jgi:hypothetical protein
LSPVAYPPSAAISLSLLFQFLRPYCSLLVTDCLSFLTCFVGSFICTFLTPHRQTIFVPLLFVELALGLPPFTHATALLFQPVNNSMSLLISEVFFHRPPISPVTSAAILTHALFAPKLQPIFVLTILIKLTLVFLLFAFCTLLHLSHSHLVPHGQPLA